MRLYIFICLSFSFFISCTSKSQGILLKKVDFNKKILIDTVETFQNKLLVVNINTFTDVRGDFDTHCGIILMIDSQSAIYEIENMPSYRITKEYIAEVDKSHDSIVNWGWYFVNKNGQFVALPQENKISDSLSKQYKDCYIFNNGRGKFWVRNEGKLIASYNYGDFVLNQKIDNIDTLAYGLYKVKNNELDLYSSDPNLINRIGEGLYYVPPPGIGVIRKFSILKILQAFESFKHFPDLPTQIVINNSDLEAIKASIN